MIEFKKYSSIENHFYKDYLDQVREQVPADMQWVVQEKVISLFNHLKQDCPDMQSVSVFGELFGGSYPHPDVQRVGRLTMIQKGVYYAPDHEFYGFDIYVFTNDGGYYLSVEQAEGLFESEGSFYAKSLFKEHSALYNVIDKSEIKIFNKELNKMISSLVKNVYMTVH